jgi:hypothetical protein
MVKLYKHARQGILLKEAADLGNKISQKKKKSLILEEPPVFENSKDSDHNSIKNKKSSLGMNSNSEGRRRSSIYLDEFPSLKTDDVDAYLDDRKKSEKIEV